jgi:hypothetical protein
MTRRAAGVVWKVVRGTFVRSVVGAWKRPAPGQRWLEEHIARALSPGDTAEVPREIRDTRKARPKKRKKGR